jgi:PAS domain S-box-containing protein
MSNHSVPVERLLSGSGGLLPSPLVVVDEHGAPVWADAAAEEWLGDGSSAEDSLDPGAAGHAPWDPVFDSGEPRYGVEWDAEGPGGETPVAVDVRPLADDVGVVRAAALTLADDDGRSTGPGGESAEAGRNSEAATGRAERDELNGDGEMPGLDLRETLDRMEDAFFVLDDDWRFSYLNGRAESLLERSESDLLGETIWEVFPGARGSAFQEQYEQAMATQESVSFEEYYEGLDEWFEVRAHPSETGLSVYFSSITDRKARERELEQYETVVETASEGIYVVDQEGRFSQANEAYAEMIDHSREELIGAHVSEVVDDEEVLAEAQRAEAELAAGERQSATVELEATDEDGRVSAWEATFALTDSGDDYQRVGVVRDVSQRRERERRLRRRREQLDALNDINTLVQGLAATVVRQTDREAVRTALVEGFEASASYETAWVGEVGPDRETVVAAAGDPVTPADDLRFDDADADGSGTHPAVEAIRTGEMQVVADLAAREDTEWARAATAAGYAGVAAVPITFEDALFGVLTAYTARPDAVGGEEREALAGLATITAHATRSVHREAQRRRSERRYRSLAQHIPNGAVISVDTDLRYQVVAGKAIETLEMQPQDIRGRRPTQTEVLPDDLAEHLEAVYRDVLDGQQVEARVEFESRMFEIEAIPLRNEVGAIVGAMSLAQDVTGRVERQRQLEYERERLEFLVRLVRHNLLNSLNVVDARLQLVDGRVDYEVAEHLETARNRAAEMIDLVETIRTLTTAMADQTETELEAVPLGEVLADQVRSASVTYPDAEFDLGEVPTVAVCGDELLEEALENLLHNAVQHNDASTPAVCVEVGVDEDVVTVSVADNGPGLPESVREALFEGRPNDFDDPGFGFGLYVVHEIVETYGGSVDVEENDPRGTVFHLRLERADGPG